ncbi:hypothetical protein DJ010_06685 [Nocardioides silvaticus]|uniref:DUF4760 domain-containing protein n=1 Tax=Nocardioides silvaticus TaxID=2201891 RepID=A0A316TNJ3_9ACTN|nr:hypothetical protein [Nocardioides silvaticus]PWN03754.1 hypothetical protein DJ010_06685 [Nocardioides silvaticus]
METFTSIASFVFASAALTLSPVTYRQRSEQDRRDLFLTMHERLIASDVQRGRRLLHEVGSEHEAALLRTNDPERYQEVNRAIAMLDVFAMYIQRGYINRETALEEWGHAFARAYEKATFVIDDRAANQTWVPWPHLRAFGPEAVRWHEAQLRS